MSLTRDGAKRYLGRALVRGAAIQRYDQRAYQTTAAFRAAEAILGGRNAVLTLPTGTGKTLICGMAAALVLNQRPDTRVLFTAPRRTLLAQLRDRSRWLGPTFPTSLVGMDPREDDRHVNAAFDYGRMVFGMPGLLANRLAARTIDRSIVESIEMLIVDEFDAFLMLRYLAGGVTVNFHEPLAALRSHLPETCRLLLVSATTPEILSPDEASDVEARVDASAQTAYRRFLDDGIDPAYVSIAERYYADFVPHAQILAVAVADIEVANLDKAIDEEMGLLFNWISGEVGFPIDPAYVLPRLTQIRAGKLGLSPGKSRVQPSGMLAGLLGRLQQMLHLPDYLCEDMARGFTREFVETWRYSVDFVDRIPVEQWRVVVPPEGRDEGVMWPEPRAKLETLLGILANHRGQRGVVFFRYVRVLEALASRLRDEGVPFVVVHGELELADNESALARFRAASNMLLLITRDSGKRGLDLPEGDFAIFYSPKSREDVTWQEVSRIRSTIPNPKVTYILFYDSTGEAAKIGRMIKALQLTAHSSDIRIIATADLDQKAVVDTTNFIPTQSRCQDRTGMHDRFLESSEDRSNV